MSELGRLQTCPAQDGMSASPLKADIATTNRNVGYGAVADSCGATCHSIMPSAGRATDVG
jgi:hypothetical protein